MKNKICFATYEIFPTTKGGVGALIANVIHGLVQEEHPVVLVLDIPHYEFQQFVVQDRLMFPNPELIQGYHVGTLCSDLAVPEEAFPSHYDWRSYRFHHACRKVYAIERPDIIEFADYCGPAYYALSAKAAGLDYRDCHLAIRLHTTIELIDAEEVSQPMTEARCRLYALEHAALRLAETVIYPSQSFLNKAYLPKYDGWLGEKVLSPPPLVRVPKLLPARADGDSVLYFGRLFGLKGVDRFVDAAILCLMQSQSRRMRFILAGYDSRMPPDSSTTYEEYLTKRIPTRFRDAFVFTGHIDEKGLMELSADLMCAVFPNYFESFCYAAHELYAAGVPLIVSPIPAFVDFFTHEKNALVFDGTASSLSNMIMRLQSDNDLHRRLRFPYSVASDRPGDFYSNRHTTSWMTALKTEHPNGTLIVILDDASDGNYYKPVFDRDASTLHYRVVYLRTKPVHTSDGAPSLHFLGRQYFAYSEDLEPCNVFAAATESSMMIIRQGDQVSSEFLRRAQQTLGSHPDFGYVIGLASLGNDEHAAFTHSNDVASQPELAAFIERPHPLRCVFALEASSLLNEILDPRFGEAGEIGALWACATRGKIGLQIPLTSVEIEDPGSCRLSGRTFSFLVLNTTNERLRKRLTWHLAVAASILDRPADLVHAQRRLTETQAELQQVRSSLGWKITVSTRDFRKRLLAALANEPVFGARLLSWLMRLRARLLGSQ